MPGAPLVAALGLELEHTQLLAAHVGQHARLHLHAAQAVGVEDRLVRAVEHGLESDARPLVGRQALDQQPLAALDAVLLASGLDDRVHGKTASAALILRRLGSGTAPSASAAAAPRL